MKTAISIPDPIFQAAEEMAHNLGVSRSELFSTAIAEYLENHKYNNVTESLNEVYQVHSGAVDKAIAEMQLHSVYKDEQW